MNQIIFASQNAIVYTNKVSENTGTYNLETCSCIHGFVKSIDGEITGEKFSIHIDEQTNIKKSILSAISLVKNQGNIILTVAPGVIARNTLPSARNAINELIKTEKNYNLTQNFIDYGSSISFIDKNGDIHSKIEPTHQRKYHHGASWHNYFENNISREIVICHLNKFQSSLNSRSSFIEHNENGWVNLADFQLDPVYKTWMARFSDEEFSQLDISKNHREVIEKFKKLKITHKCDDLVKSPYIRKCLTEIMPEKNHDNKKQSPKTFTPIANNKLTKSNTKSKKTSESPDLIADLAIDLV